VVKVGEPGVAVIADTWWHAKIALDAVSIHWDGKGNEKVSSATIDAMLKEGLGAERAFVGNSNGHAKGAIAAAVFRAELHRQSGPTPTSRSPPWRPKAARSSSAGAGTTISP
jgi:hypothetical protein